MDRYKYISEAYKNACHLNFDKNSKIVIMSDCHRGDSSGSDNFANNQNIYFNALKNYYDEGYAYIELGDGDELWKNKKFEDITFNYTNIFWLLHKFYCKNRLYMIYGNHDIVKQKKKWRDNNLRTYWDERLKKDIPLFSDINIHEAIVLTNKDNNRKLFLLHGHQADFLNYNLWQLSRFLVRNLWRPLELVGIKDPTSTSESRSKKENVELHLMDWADKNNMILLAGHTHRTAFPQKGEPLYFNDGSCVHPRCITAVEIADNKIALVKWSVNVKTDGTLYIDKTILEGPTDINYFYEENEK